MPPFAAEPRRGDPIPRPIVETPVWISKRIFTGAKFPLEILERAQDGQREAERVHEARKGVV